MVELEGDRDGTYGASGLVCGPESGPVAAICPQTRISRVADGKEDAMRSMMGIIFVQEQLRGHWSLGIGRKTSQLAAEGGIIQGLGQYD
jgi:hypothetical protein